MDFEELLETLGEQYADVTLYSVEDRDMTDHETTIEYYMEEDQAIARAEDIWADIEGEERDYRDISVHRGVIEYNSQFDRYRFVVLQKLYKSYKKTYVCEAYAAQYRQEKTEGYLAQGMDAEAAAAQAKKDFNAVYAVQPVMEVGMFAGYSYAPKERG